MPGLKQAGCITNNRLQAHLARFGNSPVAHPPSIWKHTTKDILFSLVVDNFGIKYFGKESAYHLIKTLKKLYTVSINWDKSLYCGLTIAWDCTNRTYDISMPQYLQDALHKFQHALPCKPQDAPHSWNTPNYGATIQYAKSPDPTPMLPTQSITLVQKIIGNQLY